MVHEEMPVPAPGWWGTRWAASPLYTPPQHGRARSPSRLAPWWPMCSSLYKKGKLVVWRTRAGGETPSEFKCGFWDAHVFFLPSILQMTPLGAFAAPSRASPHTTRIPHFFPTEATLEVNLYTLFLRCHHLLFGRVTIIIPIRFATFGPIFKFLRQHKN